MVLVSCLLVGRLVVMELNIRRRRARRLNTSDIPAALLRAELSSAPALDLSISIQRIALTKNWARFAAL